jgi:hypothetical protein
LARIEKERAPEAEPRGTKQWLIGRATCCKADGCFWDAKTCPEHAGKRLETEPDED